MPVITEQEVLTLRTVEQIRRLQPCDFLMRPMSETEFRHIFGLCDASWVHSGDPKNPHAELTSGKCSNGFFNCSEALKYTNICQIMAQEAVRCLVRHYTGTINWVIGSAYAGIDFSKDVANLLGSIHAFTEKGTDKEQVWQRHVIPEGDAVLQVEELMTTSLTAEEVRKGIRKGNPHLVKFAPFILVLVHRSDVQAIDGTPIIYPFHFDIWTADPSECELCKQGSKRLRPKQNWAELTGRK